MAPEKWTAPLIHQAGNDKPTMIGVATCVGEVLGCHAFLALAHPFAGAKFVGSDSSRPEADTFRVGNASILAVLWPKLPSADLLLLLVAKVSAFKPMAWRATRYVDSPNGEAANARLYSYDHSKKVYGKYVCNHWPCKVKHTVEDSEQDGMVLGVAAGLSTRVGDSGSPITDDAGQHLYGFHTGRWGEKGHAQDEGLFIDARSAIGQFDRWLLAPQQSVSLPPTVSASIGGNAGHGDGADPRLLGRLKLALTDKHRATMVPFLGSRPNGEDRCRLPMVSRHCPMLVTSAAYAAEYSRAHQVAIDQIEIMDQLRLLQWHVATFMSKEGWNITNGNAVRTCILRLEDYLENSRRNHANYDPKEDRQKRLASILGCKVAPRFLFVVKRFADDCRKVTGQLGLNDLGNAIVELQGSLADLLQRMAEYWRYHCRLNCNEMEWLGEQGLLFGGIRPIKQDDMASISDTLNESLAGWPQHQSNSRRGIPHWPAEFREA